MKKLRVFVLIVAISSAFAAGFISFLVGAISPNIAKSFGYGSDASIVVVLSSINLFGYLLGSLLSGWMIKKFSARRMIIFLLLTALVACVLLAFLGNFIISVAGFTTSWVIFSFANLVNGFSFGAIISATLYLMILVYQPVNLQSRFITIIEAFFSGGAGLGAFLGGVVINSFGSSSWYFTFYISAALFLVVIVIALVFNYQEKEFNKIAVSFNALAANKSDHKNVKLKTTKWIKTNKILNSPANLGVIFAAVGLFCYLLLQGFINFWLPNLLSNDGVDKGASSHSVIYYPYVISLYWAGVTIVQALYAAVYKQVNKHFKLYLLLVISFIFAFAATVVIATNLYSSIVLLIAAFCVGVGASLLYPLTFNFGFSMTKKINPFTSAILNSGASLGIISSTILNYLIQLATGSYFGPFYVTVAAFILYLTVIIFAYFWHKRKTNILEKNTASKKTLIQKNS